MNDPDISDDISTDVSISIGTALTSSIDTVGDVDLFRVQLVAGQTYDFTLDGLDNGPLGVALDNPELQLFDANGDLVFFRNGRLNDGVNAKLSFTATQTGDYYIGATSFNEDQGNDASKPIGDYTIGFDFGVLGNPTDSINSDMLLTDTVIDVYFAGDGEIFETPDGFYLPPVDDQFVSIGWAQSEIDLTLQAFAQLSNVANLTFQRTDSAANADLVLIIEAELPVRGISFSATDVDPRRIVFAANSEFWTSEALVTGGGGMALMLHEIGHTVGLMHPHDDAVGSTILQNVGSSRDDYGLFDLNQGIFSTMNYNPGWPLSPAGPITSTGFGHQATMMALDIAVLQEKYGANTNFNNDNTSYALPDVNEVGTFWSAIWDTGGTDEVIYTGDKDVTIDLRAATLQYEVGGGGFVSYADGILGGFTIANGVEIENGVGGSGNDTVTGNDVANSLYGNAGSDSLKGMDGHDSLHGDAGKDLIYGNNGDDYIRGGTENDDLRGSNGDDTVYGDKGRDYLRGNSGDDDLRGSTGGDTLDGGLDNDQLRGASGNDTLNGRVGNDYLSGGIGNDRLNAHEGVDTLIGGDGDDTLYGNPGDDSLSGGNGNDDLRGGNEDDTLSGDDGNDTLRGNSGDDQFNFALGDDADEILGFVAGAGSDDVIALSGFGTDFDTFAEVLAAASDDGNGNTVIDFGNGDSITLKGVDVGSLHDDDFVFA